MSNNALSKLQSLNVKHITTTGPTETGFKNQFLEVEVTPVRLPDGRDSTYSVVNPNGYAGVVVPRLEQDGEIFLGMVVQHRFPVHKVTLEFPSGATMTRGPEGAARELKEEMDICLDPAELQHLGRLDVNSGVMGNEHHVWLANLTPEDLPEEGFVEGESGAHTVWVTEEELLDLQATGHLTCGVAMASYFMMRNHLSRATLGTWLGK